MKQRLIWLSVLISLLLAACAPATAPPSANTSSSESSTSINNDGAAVENVDTSDLTRIGNTGRPQFLNAYATW